MGVTLQGREPKFFLKEQPQCDRRQLIPCQSYFPLDVYPFPLTFNPFIPEDLNRLLCKQCRSRRDGLLQAVSWNYTVGHSVLYFVLLFLTTDMPKF